MFDLKWVRENADAFDAGLAKRGVKPMSREVLALDRARRACQTTLQDGQARRNTVSREIGVAKSKGEDASDLIAEVSRLKSNLKKAEQQEKQLRAELDELMSGLPNLPADGVPEGADENDNEEIRRWGKLPEFDFEPKQHFDIGEGLGLMDFDAAAAMSGARFVVLKGALARLERALGAFMLDLQTGEFGFTEVSAPLLVRDQSVFGTGQLPKFADDLFQTTNGYWLIPTAEVPLANLARDQIHDGAKLPMRYAALTQCFRSEAGAAGKDTRGMIRQHQFTKVEMVAITEPERSADELERITKCAEEVLQRLGLCYRVVLLCAGDMGFGSQKTYDLEVWLPGQGCYREISSCSNCGEFQARRMAARYRPADGGAVRHVHTLNGSGLAVGRTLVAIIENYQQADGSVVVPAALRPYMGGLEVVTADA